MRKYRNVCLYKSVPIELDVIFFEDKNMIDLSLNFDEPEGAVAKLKFSIKISSETGKQIFPLSETAEDSYTRAWHITMRHLLIRSFYDILPMWSLNSEPFFDRQSTYVEPLYTFIGKQKKIRVRSLTKWSSLFVSCYFHYFIMSYNVDDLD